MQLINAFDDINSLNLSLAFKVSNSFIKNSHFCGYNRYIFEIFAALPLSIPTSIFSIICFGFFVLKLFFEMDKSLLQLNQ